MARAAAEEGRKPASEGGKPFKVGRRSAEEGRKPARVLLGLSGGVDSAVSAHLLKEQGFDVLGVCMVVWPEERQKRSDGAGVADSSKAARACFAPDSGQRRARVAALAGKLGIPVAFVDCAKVFQDQIMGNFRREYLAGRTPNPCVLCNPLIKFGAMVEGARRLGLEFDRIATGHYARISKIGERYCLERAVDAAKDQSYFLYRLSQNQLAKAIFPLGGLAKPQVRAMAEALGLADRGSRESSDFYPGPYSDLLGVEPKAGAIVDSEGRALGRHKGFWNYTLGQRKGLGIAAPGPLYVIALRPEANEVVVGPAEEVLMDRASAGQVCWMGCGSFEELGRNRKGFAKIRSAGEPAPCLIGSEEGRLAVRFAEKVKAPAPGQSLVVYDEEGRVLCGGTIV